MLLSPFFLYNGGTSFIGSVVLQENYYVLPEYHKCVLPPLT